MKRIYLYIILGLLTLHVCPCSAQLLATSGYDEDAGTLVVTLRNVSDSLSCQFLDGEGAKPGTFVAVKPIAKADYNHQIYYLHEDLFSGASVFLHPGTSVSRVLVMPKKMPSSFHVQVNVDFARYAIPRDRRSSIDAFSQHDIFKNCRLPGRTRMAFNEDLYVGESNPVTISK